MGMLSTQSLGKVPVRLHLLVKCTPLLSKCVILCVCLPDRQCQEMTIPDHKDIVRDMISLASCHALHVKLTLHVCT